MHNPPKTMIVYIFHSLLSDDLSLENASINERLMWHTCGSVYDKTIMGPPWHAKHLLLPISTHIITTKETLGRYDCRSTVSVQPVFIYSSPQKSLWPECRCWHGRTSGGVSPQISSSAVLIAYIDYLYIKPQHRLQTLFSSYMSIMDAWF